MRHDASTSGPHWGVPGAQRGPDTEAFQTLTGPGLVELLEDGDAVDASIPERIDDRYVPMELLASGGMGEVWRVEDERLERTVALKVVRSPLVGASFLARFRAEAKVTAQLQHPGVIPVHDVGQLPDGRAWYAMKEVDGVTVEALLQDVHRAWRMGYEATPAGFTYRRMLESFLRVCEAMAYSHAQGVIHRDLKPSNMMVGPYGEVLVVDWGLAKRLHVEDEPSTVLEAGAPHRTRIGAITGTPAYMSPEQARGASFAAGCPSDVFSLGATLYDLLCERPPRLSSTVEGLLRDVALGSPFPPPSAIPDVPPVDPELERICLRALRTDPDDRYADAGEMARELAAWLGDVRRREQALTFVDEARRLSKEAGLAEEQAVAKRAEAEAVLEPLPPNAPVSDKLPGWALQDEAAALEEATRTAQTLAIQNLRAALSHAPDLRLAQDLLADHFHQRHQALEASQRLEAARQVARDLAHHDVSGRYASYLRGVGAVTLVSDPPGAEVRLHRFVLRQRRLVPELVEVLGRTPLEAVPLEMGSYLLTLHAEGREVVRYPVSIDRQEHWHGVPPGGQEPRAVRLPALGSLRPDECFVPPGWFWWGDDGSVPGLPPFERRWCDGFAIQRFPVTVGGYAGFLNELWDRGERDAAERFQPRTNDDDVPLLHRDPDGRFGAIRDDRAGWEAIAGRPDLPMILFRGAGAVAYCEHRGGALPTHEQWVRAARGSDRRAYPWGDAFDPTWCRVRRTTPAVEPAEVGQYAADRSPFEVGDMAGNVSDLVVAADGSTWRAGGYMAAGEGAARIAFATPVDVSTTSRANVGFRCVRHLP